MHNGTVEWFRPRGYGLIKDDEDGKEYFVHYSNINAAEGEFRKLYKGEKVSFEPQEGVRDNGGSAKKTTNNAVNVSLLQASPKRYEHHPNATA